MSETYVKTQGVANKPLQRAPEASQDAPKTSQDPPNTSQDAPRWTQDGAKIPPRGPQMPPKRCLTPPRRTQDASKMTLGHPDPPPRRPKSPQDPPKKHLTPPQNIHLESIWWVFCLSPFLASTERRVSSPLASSRPRRDARSVNNTRGSSPAWSNSLSSSKDIIL